jgi:predicted nucleotidyltransferase
MFNNNSVRLANIKALEFIVTKLGDLCSKVVFLGGCTTALFITDKAAPDVRSTLDVDCIVDVISLNEYYQLEKSLRDRGFIQLNQDNVICRWRVDNAILDVMPTDEKILGFSNRWYKEAIKYAVNYPLTDVLNINVVTAPYFLATKLEAFNGRGKMDYLASHDFEDIISVIDGRVELSKEIQSSGVELRNYLAEIFNNMLKERAFHDALPGHLRQYGSLTNDRIKLLIERLNLFIQPSNDY